MKELERHDSDEVVSWRLGPSVPLSRGRLNKLSMRRSGALSSVPTFDSNLDRLLYP